MKVRRPNLEALYKEVDNYIPAKESLQPPRIGISANRRDGLSCIAETYVQAVLDAGGAPVLIPVLLIIYREFPIYGYTHTSSCTSNHRHR